MDRISILGVQFDAISKTEAVQRAMTAIRHGKKAMLSPRILKLSIWHVRMFS